MQPVQCSLGTPRAPVCGCLSFTLRNSSLCSPSQGASGVGGTEGSEPDKLAYPLRNAAKISRRAMHLFSDLIYRQRLHARRAIRRPKRAFVGRRGERTEATARLGR